MGQPLRSGSQKLGHPLSACQTPGNHRDVLTHHVFKEHGRPFRCGRFHRGSRPDPSIDPRQFGIGIHRFAADQKLPGSLFETSDGRSEIHNGICRSFSDSPGFFDVFTNGTTAEFMIIPLEPFGLQDELFSAIFFHQDNDRFPDFLFRSIRAIPGQADRLWHRTRPYLRL